jgi:hypothetical protein
MVQTGSQNGKDDTLIEFLKLYRNPRISTVKQEIRSYSSQYSARLSAHPNDLIVNLIELPDNRRL